MRSFILVVALLLAATASAAVAGATPPRECTLCTRKRVDQWCWRDFDYRPVASFDPSVQRHVVLTITRPRSELAVPLVLLEVRHVLERGPA
jgi:hypothetical protein